MLSLILCILYVVSAQPYSRVYLRGLKRMEDERMQAEYIYQGFAYIQDAIFTAAKQGHLYYTIQPPSCGSDPYEVAISGYPMLDKDICNNIVYGIRALVSERFPDSDLLYDADTGRYTLKWD